MTIDRIIDYVTETPRNSNKSVLRTMLNDIGGTDTQKYFVVRINEDTEGLASCYIMSTNSFHIYRADLVIETDSETGEPSLFIENIYDENQITPPSPEIIEEITDFIYTLHSPDDWFSIFKSLWKYDHVN